MTRHPAPAQAALWLWTAALVLRGRPLRGPDGRQQPLCLPVLARAVLDLAGHPAAAIAARAKALAAEAGIDPTDPPRLRGAGGNPQGGLTLVR